GRLLTGRVAAHAAVATAAVAVARGTPWSAPRGSHLGERLALRRIEPSVHLLLRALEDLLDARLRLAPDRAQRRVGALEDGVEPRALRRGERELLRHPIEHLVAAGQLTATRSTAPEVAARRGQPACDQRSVDGCAGDPARDRHGADHQPRAQPGWDHSEPAVLSASSAVIVRANVRAASSIDTPCTTSATTSLVAACATTTAEASSAVHSVAAPIRLAASAIGRIRRDQRSV